MAIAFQDGITRCRQFILLPFAVQWRFVLARLPWLVPLHILRITNPQGPHPFIVYLPSRTAKYTIPVHVFLPPHVCTTHIDQACESSIRQTPVHIDFHGGSFITGSCLEQAPFCALMAREMPCVALSVDYRMGPLSQFPAAVEDAEDVLAAVLDDNEASDAAKVLRRAIQQHSYSQCEKLGLTPAESAVVNLDTSRVSTSGFSSGGNIALNLALSIKTAGGEDWPSLFPPSTACPTPVPVLLFYPSFDARLLPHERPRPAKMGPAPSTPSLLASIESVLMPTYLLPHLRAHHRASPGLASPAACLHSRARVLLVLPKLDSLAEQSETWVQWMTEEGRQEQLEVLRVEGMKHGWTQFPESWISAEERQEKEKVFRRAVAFVWELAAV